MLVFEHVLYARVANVVPKVSGSALLFLSEAGPARSLEPHTHRKDCSSVIMLVSQGTAALLSTISALATGVVGVPLVPLASPISGNLEVVSGGSWTATNGQLISAHGEGILTVGDTYYSMFSLTYRCYLL